VKLKPRKYGGFNRRSSRPGVKGGFHSIPGLRKLPNSPIPKLYGQWLTLRPGILARLATRKSSDPAAVDIHGEEPSEVEAEAEFDVYKTFEIEFESSPSQVNFVQAWKEIMDARRRQRGRLAQIQEEMKREAFTGKTALAIRM
jgi:hypothetical protein